MHRLGRKVGLASLAVPGRLDAVLASLKYVVLVVVLFFTWQASELVFRGYCPAYALLGRHGEDITFWAYVISGGILLLSVVVTVPFCRWLCPLAAVMNPLSRFGLARVRRDAGACIDCGKCARACPMGIPVHAVDTVTHARCTTCLDCVDACPTRGRRTLAWRLPGPRRRVLPRGALTGVLLLLLGGAVAFAHFLPLPSFRWSRGEASPETAVLELAVHDLSCRGRANLLVYYLERDDDLALPGSIRLEAWPGPGAARARVVYDPAKVDADLIRTAITEPYYDYGLGTFRMSPFQIEGYDPLAPLPAPAEGGP
jgi:ferredoxin